MLKLSLVTASGTIASQEGSNEAVLVYHAPYTDGTSIRVETDTCPCHLVVRLDAVMEPVLVLMTEPAFLLPIPFGEKHVSYDPRSFQGDVHLLSVRRAMPAEVRAYRNLALNPYDHHGNTALFPHASANVETRGESVFAARNAIDGYRAASGHGIWPYSSWGINRNPQAALRIDFGTPVQLDQVVLYLRADFPHDAWWEKASLHFSDGSQSVLSLEKLDGAQRFPLEGKETSFIVLDTLIKADDPSPFPALTQMEAWGVVL